MDLFCAKLEGQPEPLVSGEFAGPHEINYALSPSFWVPGLNEAEINWQCKRFEWMWESKCNVTVTRRPWGWGGGRLFKYVSKDIRLPGGYTALGLAHFESDSIDIHNGTRQGGRRDYWYAFHKDLLSCVMGHELAHWIWSSGGVDGQGHSGDVSCIMNSNMAAKDFCSAEIRVLRQRYGNPASVPPYPSPLVKGVWDLRGMAPFEFRQGGENPVIPIMGRWDGVNYGPGLYDQATGMWYLRKSLSSGEADIPPFQYGPTNRKLQPLVGDWDGNGKDGIGLYDSVSGTWYLKNVPGPGVADATIKYGPGGGIALDRTIGTFREQT